MHVNIDRQTECIPKFQVEMNAVGLYVSAARLVLQNDSRDYMINATTPPSVNEQSLLDLFRLLPHLRQSLSCAVCTRMLTDPFAPKDARCQHNVCRLCVRGRKQIRPSCPACKDCQDFKIYEENKQMRCLLLCYKSLCEHLVSSPLFQQICKQRSPPLSLNSGIAVPSMSAKEFIMEGASYDDMLSAFSIDLPRPKLAPAAVLPPISYSNSTASLVPLSAAALPLPKAAAIPSTVHHQQQQQQQQQQQLSTHNFPLPVIIKQEHASSSITTTSHAISQVKAPTVVAGTSAQTTKKSKSLNDLAPVMQAASNAFPTSSAVLSQQTFTYVSNATPAGVVVPLLSSSATAATSNVTTAPLTIASAKLQSISRQLAAQQQRTFLNACTSTLDIKQSTPLTFKLAPATSIAGTTVVTAAPSLIVTTTTATVTSQQVRNPPPIKTVSNGSAMYSVLYTGIGNKITIKRKTDGDEDNAQKKSIGISTATATPGTAVVRQPSKTNSKRRGCRCGNATPTPGKLTCCGQRCPCYVDSKSCIGCKCRGCRNPHRPDGGKVRPVIPELACYEIQMADSENLELSPGELPIATTTTIKPAICTPPISTHSNSIKQQSSILSLPLENLTIASTPLLQSQVPPQSLPTPRLTIVPTSSSTTTSSANVAPYRHLQHQVTSSTQHQQQHQQQHILHPTHTNVLQLENFQRESLLIQSAEGKYQVVNVFTTATSQHNHNNASVQRIHTLPQLQASTTPHNSNSNNNNNNNTNTFILQSASNGIGSSPASNTMQHMCQIPEISTTLPQIIMQQTHADATNSHFQQQQHNHNYQHQHQHQQTQRAHLQHHLKTPNNIITVHPISSPVKPIGAASGVVATTGSTPTIAPPSITLSPILVASPHSTYTSTDIFSGESSSEEYLNDININSAAAAALQSSTTISVSTGAQISPMIPLNSTSPFSLSSNNSNNAATSIMGTIGSGQQQQHHYVELIESADLHLLRADDLFLTSR